MANWLAHVLRWFSGKGAAPADQAILPALSEVTSDVERMPPVIAEAALGAAGDAEAIADLELRFFHWLTGDVPGASAPDADGETRLLAHVDVISRSEQMRADLLPRARSVIPELLHSLRDDTQSVRALSARVARDPNLVVEVIRLANTVGHRADTPVADLMQAISRLGTEGLRQAIARVLLKPIFDAQADPLLARATQRLWQQSELKASLCLQQATSAGLDPFESYLAGLMHNIGWTALFRAIDRSPEGAPGAFSPALIYAMSPRRDRLFALFVGSWELSDALTLLAREVLLVGFAAARNPLAQLLLYADRVSAQQLLQPPTVSSPNTDSAGV